MSVGQNVPKGLLSESAATRERAVRKNKPGRTARSICKPPGESSPLIGLNINCKCLTADI